MDECGFCDGPGIVEGTCNCEGYVEDCLGVCGGDACEDICGVCNGPGIEEQYCDCYENVLDCFDECGGTAVL